MERVHEFFHGLEHHFEQNRLPKHGTPAPSRGDYGQDVPVFTLLFFVVGVVLLGLGTLAYKGLGAFPALALLLGLLLAVLGHVGVIGGLFLIWASRFGKYQMRDRVMADINWRGDEQVLDVGCGAGLLLIGAARNLTIGKATGVDLWDKNLEYGSNPETVWANARREGVADRIEVKDGDACHLPFPAASFDLVTTSNMLHHLSSSDRMQALREMGRVLKPGGSLVIAEIAFIGQTVATLKACGFQAAQEAPLNMILWRRVVAKK
jgi:arsenite methyltransferase